MTGGMQQLGRAIGPECVALEHHQGCASLVPEPQGRSDQPLLPPGSCGMKLNLDYLLEMLWEYLALTCIYTKKRGRESVCSQLLPFC